jgi:transcriptional regulator with XRE-family HTH domain
MARRKKEGLTVVETVRAAITESGQSLNQLSKVCGVGRDRLSRFVRGERGIGLDALDKICQALGLRLVGQDQPEEPAQPARSRHGRGRKRGE